MGAIIEKANSENKRNAKRGIQYSNHKEWWQKNEITNSWIGLPDNCGSDNCGSDNCGSDDCGLDNCSSDNCGRQLRTKIHTYKYLFYYKKKSLRSDQFDISLNLQYRGRHHTEINHSPKIYYFINYLFISNDWLFD